MRRFSEGKGRVKKLSPDADHDLLGAQGIAGSACRPIKEYLEAGKQEPPIQVVPRQSLETSVILVWRMGFNCPLPYIFRSIP